MSAAVRRPTLLVLVLLLALAGCGSGERWGGYTEDEAKDVMVNPEVKATIIEAKDVMVDPEVKGTIIEATPRKDGQQPVAAIYPDEEKLDEEGLRKVKMQGTDAWEYNDVANDFCLYVWFDKPTNGFLAQASHCVGVQQ